MKEITLYKCEVCGTEYKFSKDAETCERHHVKPISNLPIAEVHYRPYTMNIEPYPYKIAVKMDDGATIYYKR